MMKTDEYVTIWDINKAKEVLQDNARKTPLVKSFYLTSVTEANVYLKLENMQLTGSFKFRGAYNKIATLTTIEKEHGVIACSAGNHAQGVALSSKLLGINSKIVMPETAPQAKIDATRGYGSDVVLYGQTFDEAKEKCIEIAEKTGRTFLHPYDDPAVIAGQGTIGLEILDNMWDVDTVIVPIGGGGLISGIAIALKSFNPNIRIIGVQAENVHGMKSSFDAGKITPHYAAPTMADGCAVKVPGDITFSIVKELVDEIITVSEDELEQAMKDLLQRGKAVVEGAGALSTAALVSDKITDYVKGKNVVCIISGGNVDLERISQVCEHFFSSEVVE